MTEMLTETKHCPACEAELQGEVCLNPECPEAQAIATADATRETQKAASATGSSTAAATRTEPRSFARSGYSD